MTFNISFLAVIFFFATFLLTNESYSQEEKKDNTAPTVKNSQAIHRPFRLEVVSFNPYFDQTKPLAMTDVSGFVVSSDILIGSFREERKDKNWVGGYSVATGKYLWWIEGSSSLTTPPTVIGSSVILGFRDGKLIKADITTGKKIWETTLDSYANRKVVLSGTVIFVLTSAQVLYAVDFQTGKPLWLYDGGFPDSLPIAGGVIPAVYRDLILIGLSSGEIHAVNMKNGKEIWKFNPSFNEARFHDVIGDFVVIENNILLMTRYDGIVAAVNLAGSDRTAIWLDKQASITTSHYANGVFYVGKLSGGEVVAYDPKNGSKLWSYESGEPIAAIADTENAVFIAGTKGRISSLDKLNGALKWHDDIGGHIEGAPLFFNNGIYFQTALKNLYGYAL